MNLANATDAKEATMKQLRFIPAVVVAYLLILPGCDSSCGWSACPQPALPIELSVDGAWTGDAVTPAPADVSTSFEFDANGPFSVGTSPRTATFSNGVAEARGTPEFHITGDFSWYVLVGTSATVTFETLPSSLSFWVRTENPADVSEIQIFDEAGALIQSVTPTDVYQEIDVTRLAGETFIGTFDVNSTSGGDVIIDNLTLGFSSTTDGIDCVVAISLEVACVLTDTATDEVIGAAQAAIQVTNNNQVSGTGVLYAAPGFVLTDGSVVTALTITGGTFIERDTLNLTVDAAGVTSTVSTLYDAIYERGSSLDTVGGVYSSFDIFGDPSSFAIDANGAISAQSNSGCIANGQVTIIDGLFNAYDVDLDVSGCAGLDGSYDGLGITQDSNATDDEFPFAVFSGQTTIVGAPVK
jgi:hypothetical protein